MARLTKVDVDFISLVKKGSNKQKINIYKSADYEPDITHEENEEMKGFFYALKSYFIKEKEQPKENKKESEDIELKKEDIAEIFKEAIQPLNDRLDKLEKGETELSNTKAEGEEVKEDLTKEDISKAFQEALQPLTERIDKIESFRGISKQIDDINQTEVRKESTSVFAGIDI